MLLQAVQPGVGVEAGRPWVAQSSADFLQGLYSFFVYASSFNLLFFFFALREGAPVCAWGRARGG